MQGRECWRGIFAGSQLTEQTEVDSQKNNESSGCTQTVQWHALQRRQVFSVCTLHSVKEKRLGKITSNHIAFFFFTIYVEPDDLSHRYQTLCSFQVLCPKLEFLCERTYLEKYIILIALYCYWTVRELHQIDATYRRCSGHQVIFCSSRLHCCVNPDRFINGRFFHFSWIGMFQNNQST